MEAALPVQSVPYDKNVEITGDISSMSAEEYLSWVSDQAKRLPVVLKIKEEEHQESHPLQPAYPAIPSIPQLSSSNFLPKITWERDLLQNFAILRKNMKELGVKKERDIKVPALKDSLGWLQFCIGINNDQIEDNENMIEVDSNKIIQEAIEIEKVSGEINNEKESEEGLDEQEDIRKRKREVAFKLGIVLNTEDEDIEEDKENYSDDLSDIENDMKIDTEIKKEIWKQHPPRLNLLAQFDQVLTQRILKFLINYVETNEIDDGEEDYEEDDDDNVAQSINLIETNIDEMNENFNCNISLIRDKNMRNQLNSTVQWIYSLLSRLEKPLHREVESEIRRLYRASSFLRYHFVEDYLKNENINSENEDKEDFESVLALLNTLITLSGSYFLQDDDINHYKEIGLSIKRDDDEFEDIFNSFNINDSEDEDINNDDIISNKEEKLIKMQEFFLTENKKNTNLDIEDGEVSEDDEEDDEENEIKKKIKQ